MRTGHRRVMWIVGLALGLGAAAGPTRAQDNYYLDDGSRPVRFYEPVRVNEPIRVYEPVRVYTVDPYFVGPGYPVYSYRPGWVPYYDGGYSHREYGYSIGINLHFGSGGRYRGSSGHIGFRYYSHGYHDQNR